METAGGMGALLTVVAAILALTGIAHSYLGERYILVRLFRRGDLPRLFGSEWFTQRTLRFAWHLTSVAWLGFAGIVLVVARAPASSDSLVLQVVAATFAVHAVVTAVASRGRHLAWLAFGLAAWLSWAAS